MNFDNGRWFTIFLVVGDSVHENILPHYPNNRCSFVAKGTFEIPHQDRLFDPRYNANCWKSWLTGSQYKRAFKEQLDY